MISDATARQLTHRLAVEQSQRRLPSVAAALVRGGQLLWSGAVGAVDGLPDGTPATTDTQYRMGSITKTFTAVLVMQLRDEGLVDLDDPVDRHVPDAGVPGATVAQLLSHSSGLQAETDGSWWERSPGREWGDLAGHLVQRHRPGRRHHYSNTGYAVLGRLVERHRGDPWAEVLRERVLDPLGMARTTYLPAQPAASGLGVHPFADLVLREAVQDTRAMAPAGQLWSTVDDLARWARFVGGETGGVLTTDTLEEMRQPMAWHDVPDEPWTAAHGLGIQVWNRDGRRYAGHGGSMPGFLANLHVGLDDPRPDGVVTMANATTGLTGELGTDLLRILAEGDPSSPPTWHAVDVDAGVRELLGLWHWGTAPHELRAAGDGQLELRPIGTSGRGSRFRRDGSGANASGWIGLDGYFAGEPLEVRHTREGTAYLDVASFRFTRVPYQPDADIPGGVDQAGWYA